MNPKLVIDFFAFLTFLLQLAIVIFFVKRKYLIKKVQKYALEFGFLISFISTLGSLIFSEVLGLKPCLLCWFQRIFMYPQTIIFAIALVKNYKKEIFYYSLGLSLVGAVISLYHIILQFLPPKLSFVECSSIGYSVSCSEKFSAFLGYITIPVMAFTAFLALIIISLSARKKLS